MTETLYEIIMLIDDNTCGCKNHTRLMNYLNALSNLENELNIGVDVFWKMLDKDIFIRWDDEIMQVDYDDKYPNISEGNLFCHVRDAKTNKWVTYTVPIDGYGKDWAFTPEELYDEDEG